MSTFDNEFNTILIIDDNEAIHQDFAKIFAHSDSDSELDDLDAELFGDAKPSKPAPSQFHLQFASQGKEGLQVLTDAYKKNLRFGVAFVDMRMPPGWDGVETIEQLWKVDPDLQVVICTAYSDRSWDEIFERLGKTDNLLILKKPFDEIEVVQLASSLSKKRQLLEQARSREISLKNVVKDQRAELVEAHQDAEVLIESMTSVLISLDENGVVSKWNSVAAALFGVTIHDAVGASFQTLPIAWTQWELIEAAFLDCQVVNRNQLEIQFTDSEGILRTLDRTICPILNDATWKARLFLANDITNQKALQTQLDQALRLESVGQLAAGVAHEINTPMQYIGDNVRFVAKSLKKLDPVLECLHLLADPEVTDQQLSEIRKAIPETTKAKKVKSSLQQIPDALNDAIEGVVSVSKIVAAMKEFSHPGSDQKSQVCVNHVLESTITVAKNEWKYVAEIELDLDENLIKIDALPSELNQAFLNIIVNAAHAIGDRVNAKEFAKGSIRLTTKSADDHIVVTVQDNGGGIPAHAREKVFEPFFTTKDVGKGTGQGLAIAFGVIVQKHQGELSFTVEEGVGTTFNIILPRDANPEPASVTVGGPVLEVVK